ncbi:alpha-xenorhabdolysin family binary toxin subunit A [Vibrio cholerae]|uniref:alpha-xenorhabdolysin family binary toxin subunit A n=1 Tax=Vibrio cholerae TaxID=666 RepID=UPI003966CFEA
MKRRDFVKIIPAICVFTTLPLRASSKNISINRMLKSSYDLDAFAGVNIFSNTINQLILTDNQWLQIKLYTKHAANLPTTASEFKYEFSIPEDSDIQGFNWLMSCYSELKSSAIFWNETVFENLVQEIRHMTGMCDTQAKVMSWIYACIRELKRYADQGDSVGFENTKLTLMPILDLLHGYASRREPACELIRNQMIEYNNTLSVNAIQLDRLEEKYSELLTNYNSEEIKSHITRLRKEVDDLNAEYTRLVTIAATTPTYAWVPFWGWFIAPAVAGVYGAQAAEVNRTREEKLTELRTLETSLSHGDKIFRSWELAKQSILTTNKLIEPATQSLGLLIGEWRTVERSLSNFINSISELDSNLDEDNIIAAILAEFTAKELEENWSELTDKCRQFIQSITVETTY